MPEQNANRHDPIFSNTLPFAMASRPQQPQLDTGSHDLSFNNFEFGKSLYRAKYTNVYLARTKKTKILVVLKVLTPKTKQEQLQREVNIQRFLQRDHTGILPVHDCFWENSSFVMVLEFCMAGSLHDAIKEEVMFTNERSASYVSQLANVLHYCHSNGVIHRDIKPLNILLGKNDVIKLADFGISKRDQMFDGMSFLHTMIGTPGYMAPEMVLEKEYGVKVDVWALGIVLYEMLHGILPFYDPDVKAEEQRIVKLDYSCKPFINDKAQQLISALLVLDPDKRIDLRKVPKHPWIKEFHKADSS